MKLFLFIYLLFYGFLTAFDLDKVQDFKAQFSQLIVSENQNIVYRGTIFVKKPNLVHWKYIYPVKKDVYILGNKITIIEHDLEQVTVKYLSEEIPFFKILSESKRINKELYKTTVNKHEAFLVLKNNEISRIFYKDSFDNDVSIRLLNLRQNINMSFNVFKINHPEYYDLIQE
jgi:outer membrane lipoprotein carrier protein